MRLFERLRKKQKKDEADVSIGKSSTTLAQDVKTAFAENLKFIYKDVYTPDEIQKLFTNTEDQTCISIGEVNFPTGEIVVADPLCYLYNPEYSHPLNYTVAAKSYPVYISVCQLGTLGPRIVAAKLNITDKDAVRYEIAMPKEKTIEQYNEPGVLAGFGVDAGMSCFCDKKTAEEYRAFISKWHKKNPGKNHYDDYFAALFAESYHAQPNVQREGGDFIMWAIPETGNRIAMFASGLGDGLYLSLWGFDKDNQICELAIPFINPELFAAIESERPKKQFRIAGADIKELLNWEGASGCFATDRIMVDGCKVGYMYREKPDEGRSDSGWRFFSGDESDEYVNNPDNVGVYHLNTIANYDQDIIPLLNSPHGSAFGRDKNGTFQKEKL